MTATDDTELFTTPKQEVKKTVTTKTTEASSALWQIVEEWRAGHNFPPNDARIAKHLGVTRSAISQWKLNQARPKPESFEKLVAMVELHLGPNARRRLLNALLTDLGYLKGAEA